MPKPSFLPNKMLQITSSYSKTISSSQNNARHAPKNGQARRRPLKQPGSNTRFCPDFVSMILGQKGACWLFIPPKLLKYDTYRIEVPKCVSSVRQNQRGSWWKVVFVVVEVLPARSKPPAVVGERISKGVRHDLGAAAPCLSGHRPLNKGEPEVR